MEHKAKTDIGIIGKQGRFTQFGFFQHTALCIFAQDVAIGIFELDFILYWLGRQFKIASLSQRLSRDYFKPLTAFSF